MVNCVFLKLSGILLEQWHFKNLVVSLSFEIRLCPDINEFNSENIYQSVLDKHSDSLKHPYKSALVPGYLCAWRPAAFAGQVR